MSCERALEQKHRLFYRFLHFHFHINYFSFTHPTFRRDWQRVLEILCSSHLAKKKHFSPSLSNFLFLCHWITVSLGVFQVFSAKHFILWVRTLILASSSFSSFFFFFFSCLLETSVFCRKIKISRLLQDLWPRPTGKCLTLTGVDKTSSAAPGSPPSGVTSSPSDSPPSDQCLHSCTKMLFFFPDMNFKWKSNRRRKCFLQEKQIRKVTQHGRKKKERENGFSTVGGGEKQALVCLGDVHRRLRGTWFPDGQITATRWLCSVRRWDSQREEHFTWMFYWIRALNPASVRKKKQTNNKSDLS